MSQFIFTPWSIGRLSIDVMEFDKKEKSWGFNDWEMKFLWICIKFKFWLNHADSLQSRKVNIWALKSFGYFNMLKMVRLDPTQPPYEVMKPIGLNWPLLLIQAIQSADHSLHENKLYLRKSCHYLRNIRSDGSLYLT